MHFFCEASAQWHHESFFLHMCSFVCTTFHGTFLRMCTCALFCRASAQRHHESFFLHMCSSSFLTSPSRYGLCTLRAFFPKRKQQRVFLHMCTFLRNLLLLHLCPMYFTCIFLSKVFRISNLHMCNWVIYREHKQEKVMYFVCNFSKSNQIFYHLHMCTKA